MLLNQLIIIIVGTLVALIIFEILKYNSYLRNKLKLMYRFLEDESKVDPFNLNNMGVKLYDIQLCLPGRSLFENLKKHYDFNKIEIFLIVGRIKKLISLLNIFKINYDNALISAHALNLIMKNFIRIYNFKSKIDGVNDSSSYSYIVGKIFDFQDQQLEPFFNFGIDDIPTWVIDCYTKIQGDEAFIQVLKIFKEKSENLNKIYIEILSIWSRYKK